MDPEVFEEAVKFNKELSPRQRGLRKLLRGVGVLVISAVAVFVASQIGLDIGVVAGIGILIGLGLMFFGIVELLTNRYYEDLPLAARILAIAISIPILAYLFFIVFVLSLRTD